MPGLSAMATDLLRGPATVGLMPVPPAPITEDGANKDPYPRSGRRDSPPVHRDRQHDGGRLAARKIRGWPRHGTELGSRRRSAAHLAQARHVDTAPLPDQARLATIPRANPYPEVTDPICRLPLPTLFYRLEAIHLGDLLRIWVRAGAVFLVALSRIFKVRGEDPDTAVTAVLFAEETTLPGSPGGVSGSFWVTPTSSRKREPDSNGSAAGFRNRNRIPFRPTGASETLTSVLGSTDSCATAVHKKPFSTSVLQGLAGVFATTTKICAGDGSRRALAQTLLRTSPRPSYSSRPNGASPDERGPPDLPLTAEYRHDATAPSIFRASRFGRRVGQATETETPPTGVVNSVRGRAANSREWGRPDLSPPRRARSPACDRPKRRSPHERSGSPPSFYTVQPTAGTPAGRPGDNERAKSPGSGQPPGRRPRPNGSRRPTEREVRSSAGRPHRRRRRTVPPSGIHRAVSDRHPDAGKGGREREDVNLSFRDFGPSPFTPERFHVLLNSLFKVLFNFPSRAALSSNPTLRRNPSGTGARRSTGLAPSTDRGPVQDGLGQSAASRSNRALPNATFPGRLSAFGIRRWALPSSLAATGGILFFIACARDRSLGRPRGVPVAFRMGRPTLRTVFRGTLKKKAQSGTATRFASPPSPRLRPLSCPAPVVSKTAGVAALRTGGLADRATAGGPRRRSRRSSSTRAQTRGRRSAPFPGRGGRGRVIVRAVASSDGAVVGVRRHRTAYRAP
ncbi:hypothetical protein AAG570_004835 [Ranatra chinensis]|uniref:Uncharacterized protein n=1 Tax=Ranatra chinensis TaxID=642074 RepID=A0ABD0YMA4_9HEMI